MLFHHITRPQHASAFDNLFSGDLTTPFLEKRTDRNRGIPLDTPSSDVTFLPGAQRRSDAAPLKNLVHIEPR